MSVHYYNVKKTRILDVATELFSRHPYHKVAMDTIAEKANVAKGTLYYHFKSKEELYASLLHEGIDSLLKKLNQEFNSRSAEEKLKTVISELIGFFNENRDFFVVLQQEEAKLLSKKMRNCYEKICTVKELLVSIINEGIKDGSFINTGRNDLIAEMILGMIRSPVVKGQYDKQIHEKIMAEILFSGLKGGRNG
jgi:AcrR family transcriptional regulator